MDSDDSGDVTRGYNWVKPNWQDVLIKLFEEAWAALDQYETNPNAIAVKVTKLHSALQYNIRRNRKWEERWNLLHAVKDGQPRKVDFQLRAEELGLYVELAMDDGMVWPRTETNDEEATQFLEDVVRLIPGKGSDPA